MARGGRCDGAAGIKAFWPNAAAAQLEADKAFSKQLMRSGAISTAEGRVFDRFSDAKAYIASRDEPVVIKAAGLAKGKGVIVCDDPAQGILAAERIMVDKIFGPAATGDRGGQAPGRKASIWRSSTATAST
jgi:phosphoribosylamine--glycine ligase